MVDNKEENKEENGAEVEGKISFLPARSGNKTVYLVAVDDRKRRQFVTRNLEQKETGIELIGYEVSDKAKVTSHRDAVDEANKGSKELFNIIFPWYRIISIRNVTYTLPQ